MTGRPRLAVVGGGIAGLAAAWEVRDRAEVTVFEPGRLGGKLRTEPFEGREVDSGADAFLTRVPEAVGLAAELGLSGQLVAPAAGQALVWWGGRLHPLPPELVLGAPRRLGPLLGSRLLGPVGVARAGLDLLLPPTRWEPDVSVHELIRRRFGRQVADRLVEPLVGSIHAGRTEELSAAATAPQLLAAARRSRSLMLGLRHPPAAPAGTGQAPATPAGTGQAPASPGAPGRPAGTGPAPVFLAPSGGMQQLVDRLVAGLGRAGVTFVPARVARVGPLPSGQVTVTLNPPAPAADPAPWDGVVLATPPSVAADLLGAAAPPDLAGIPTVGVTLVTMEYRAADLVPPPGASGILVSRDAGMVMTACTFADRKWPHLARPGRVLVRVSAGRDGDDRPDQLDDEALVRRLSGELGRVAGATGSPLAWRVTRWPAAFPQYRVGHLQRVAAVEAFLREAAPSVALAGAGYQGTGVPACIASGRRAAAAVADR